MSANRFGLSVALALVVVAVQVSAGPIVNEHQKLTGDLESSDQFGTSVAIAGDWAVVTTNRFGDESFVYRRESNGTPNDPTDDVWVEHGTIIGIDPEEGPVPGIKVAMSEDRIVLGPKIDPMSQRVGFVFVRDDNGTPDDPGDDVWQQQAMLEASISPAHPLGIHTVSMSGDRILVGMTGTAHLEGRAYIFRLDDNATPGDPTDDAWVEEAILEPPELEEFDHFGESVGLASDWAVVYASQDDDAGEGRGAVYVFRREDNATPSDATDDFWVQHDKLLSPDDSEFDAFGASMRFSELATRLVVGARLHNGPAVSSGAAFVYRRDDAGTPPDLADDVWTLEVELVPAAAVAHAKSGVSVGIQEDRILVGASGLGCIGGGAFVFQFCDGGTPGDESDDRWVESTALFSSDMEGLGTTASIDGPWMIVGSPLQSAIAINAGAAYLFLIEPVDCNANGVPDACEPDCNANGLADECDLAPGGGSTDLNGDGVPDECLSPPMGEDSVGMPCLPGCNSWTQCENLAVCLPGQDGILPGTCYVPKNRYVSAAPNPKNTGVLTARRVSVSTTGGPVVLGWMGAPSVAPGLENALVSDISETPVFRDWNLDGTIHLGDCHISPGWTYLIESTVDEVTFSDSLVLTTVDDWGDVIGPLMGDAASPPQGATNLEDVFQIVLGFQGASAAPKVWLDLEPLNLNGVINLADVLQAVFGFQGGDFFDLPGAMDPCQCAGLGPCP